MLKLKGYGVFDGIVCGKIFYYKRVEVQLKRNHINNTELEKQRFETALKQVNENLERLYADALEKVGEDKAEIFKIHQMMLEDEDYCDSVRSIIESEKITAEYAVAETEEKFSRLFSSMDDSYMKARAADVKDISENIIHILFNAHSVLTMPDYPVILMADDLTPSETIKLDKNNILAMVMAQGSLNSHTSILARTMNIPTVVNVGNSIKEEFDGKDVIVDGYTGEIFIQPDEVTKKIYKQKKSVDDQRQVVLKELKGKENRTLDGKKIDIYANIGEPGDIEKVLLNDAGGIGLFRSEFIYIGRDNYPTEDEQFEAYTFVAKSMVGKKVIIRTLDIGSDKRVDYFKIPKEENPAMGYRAIRICLTQQDIFKTQLRALLRASAFGKIAIMFPMIISVDEVRQIKKIEKEIEDDLARKNIDFDKNIELGIMIETPAAALISMDLAKEVDFFSIGTNDLTQYTLAIDRQNSNLDKFFNPYHKAVLKLIKMIVDNAHKNGIWVGICGELGADLNMTETFLSMGIDELSVSPPYIFPIREKVRGINVESIRTATLSGIE